TPTVTLERETPAGSGTYVPVTRRSGRVVDDSDFLLTWTPDPVARATPTSTRTHYWVVQWQAAGVRGTADGMADLVARQALPLGRYRFHVQGTRDGAPYTLDS